MAQRVTALVFTIILVSAGPRAVARQWVDKTGKFSVEAAFVEQRGDAVLLRKANGKVLFVPLARLCSQDQDFVREAVGRKNGDETDALPLDNPVVAHPPAQAVPPASLERSTAPPTALAAPDSPARDTPRASPSAARAAEPAAATPDLPPAQPAVVADRPWDTASASSANEIALAANTAARDRSAGSEIAAVQSTTGFWVRVSLMIIGGLFALGLRPLFASLLVGSLTAMSLAYFKVLPVGIGFEVGLAGAFLLGVAITGVKLLASNLVSYKDFWVKAVGFGILGAALILLASRFGCGAAWAFANADALVAGFLLCNLGGRVLATRELAVRAHAAEELRLRTQSLASHYTSDSIRSYAPDPPRTSGARLASGG